MTEKDVYVEKLKAQLDQWNAEVSKLEAKAEKARAETKAKYEEQIMTLRERRKDAQHKMAEIQEANEQAWDHLREGVEKAWKAMEESIRKAWSVFK